MINIYKDGLCKTCNLAELELDDAWNRMFQSVRVRCIHEEACERAEKLTVKRIVDGEENETAQPRATEGGENEQQSQGQAGRA